MNSWEFEDMLNQWSANNPYYYTDGRRFFANPSYRKMRGLQYVGRYPHAKEARQQYEYAQRILSGK